MLKKLILVLICLSVATTVFAGEALIRIYGLSSDELMELERDGFDIASVSPGSHADLVIYKSDQYRKLEHRGYNWETVIDFSERSPLIAEEYITYDEMMTMLDQWETDYPNIAKIYDIGDSWEKAEAGEGYIPKDIWAMKVSDLPDEEENETSILICGLHHSREPPTVNVTMHVLEHLLVNYQTDPDIQTLVDNLEIWFVPIVNPDGLRIITDDVDVWWRKNTRDNNGNGIFDTEGYGYGEDGVDLNRNYSVHWEDASDNPSDATYHGEYPFSEPEIASLRDLILQQNFAIVHTYHTYGDMILWAWGWTYEEPPDSDLLESIGVAMAEFNGYDPFQASGLYPTGGAMDDWVYAKTGAPCYTTEIGDEFIPPGDMLEEFCAENLPTDIYLMERVLRSKVCGNITDAESGDPLPATYKILEVPDHEEFAPRTADSLHGRFDRLLLPGDYTLKISHFGYHTQQMDITITEDEATEVQFQLTEKDMGDLEGVVTNTANEPIENAIVNIYHDNLAYQTATTDAEGNYFFDDIYNDYTYQFEISAASYDTLRQDVYIPGDEIVTQNFMLAPVESFEEDDGNFVGDGEWEWGIPTEDGGPAEVFHGDKLWGTNLDGIYADQQTYDLYSPEYDFSYRSEAYLKFYQWLDTKENWDGGNVHVSTDGGENWELLTPDGGYTHQAIVGLNGDPGFSGQTQEWQVCTIDLDDYLGESSVQFRFHFGSFMNTLSCKGWFIDYVVVYENTPSDIQEDHFAKSPEKINLYQNYPNPFNPTTTIQFKLPEKSDVSLRIYDITGKLVRTLMNEEKEAGYHSVIWDGNDEQGAAIHSGVYFYKIETDGYSDVKRCVMLK